MCRPTTPDTWRSPLQGIRGGFGQYGCDVMPPIPVGGPSGSVTGQKWVFGVGVPGGGTWWRYCSLPGQSGANELRAASRPCCAGTGDGAGGSALVDLDTDAGLNDAVAALLPSQARCRRSGKGFSEPLRPISLNPAGDSSG